MHASLRVKAGPLQKLAPVELQDAAQPEDHAAPQKASEAAAKVSNAGVKTKPAQPTVSKVASAGKAKVIKAAFKAEAKVSKAGVKIGPEVSKTTAPTPSSVNKVSPLVSGTLQPCICCVHSVCTQHAGCDVGNCASLVGG